MVHIYACVDVRLRLHVRLMYRIPGTRWRTFHLGSKKIYVALGAVKKKNKGSEAWKVGDNGATHL